MKLPAVYLHRTLIAAALVFGLTISLNGAAFMKLGDIKGEAKDDAHRDEIDVLAWSWGMSNSGSTHQAGGGGAGEVNFGDIHVIKELDKSSPKLMESCANGAHIPEAILTVRRAGSTGEPLEYLIIRMENVLVTSVSTGGSGGEDRLTENVTLNFSKIQVEYTEQKEDGSTGEKVGMSWDIVANTP